MNGIDLTLRRTIQITGVFQVILGVTFWTGGALRLIPVHMLTGVVFVVAILLLGLRAGMLGAGWGAAAAAFAYGVFVIAFGMNQAQILPGPYHWIVRALHLLVGFGAMGMADAIWKRIARRGRTAVAAEASTA